MVIFQVTLDELERLIGKQVEKAFEKFKEDLVKNQTNTESKEDLFLSIKEACQLLKISKPTLYGLLESGVVSSIKVGKRRLIHRQSLIDSFEK